jgi:hypothetical protein
MERRQTADRRDRVSGDRLSASRGERRQPKAWRAGSRVVQAASRRDPSQGMIVWSWIPSTTNREPTLAGPDGHERSVEDRVRIGDESETDLLTDCEPVSIARLNGRGDRLTPVGADRPEHAQLEDHISWLVSAVPGREPVITVGENGDLGV